MGRPSKLTSETQNAIIKGVQLGLTYESAAEAAGIGVSTLYLWKAKGEKASRRNVYVEFLEALKKAEAEGERILLTRIHKAAQDGTWQAAAWILERRHSDRWSRLEKREVSVDWRQEITALILSGQVTQEQVTKELGDGLARELFESAGIPVTTGRAS